MLGQRPICSASETTCRSAPSRSTPAAYSTASAFMSQISSASVGVGGAGGGGGGEGEGLGLG